MKGSSVPAGPLSCGGAKSSTASVSVTTMKKRGARMSAVARLLLTGSAALITSLWIAAPASAQLVAGPNANVVGGPACSQSQDDECPFQIFGDVSIQRQNEGSMACSSTRVTSTPHPIDASSTVSRMRWLIASRLASV